MWLLNNMILNNYYVNESKGKLKNNVTNENGNTAYQNVCNTAKPVLRRKLTAINIYIQEKEKISNKQPNFISQGIRKRRTN